MKLCRQKKNLAKSPVLTKPSVRFNTTTSKISVLEDEGNTVGYVLSLSYTP